MIIFRVPFQSTLTRKTVIMSTSNEKLDAFIRAVSTDTEGANNIKPMSNVLREIDGFVRQMEADIYPKIIPPAINNTIKVIPIPIPI